MVFCTRCGTKNPDDAKVCSNCGAQLYVTGRRKDYERLEGECFGIPGGGMYVAIAIGVIIMLSGAIYLLQQSKIIPPGVEVWPIATIIFGILIIIGAMARRRRQY